MIKVHEMRVGNYYDHNGEIKQVTPNTILEVWESERTWCKPIPLSEDILLRLGFENKNLGKHLPQSWWEIKYLSNEHDDYLESWVSLMVNTETWSCVICDETYDQMGANTKQKIKYLHQLMNLYFTLTGTELKLNP